MKENWYSLSRMLQVCLMIVILIIIQANYGLLLTICVFIIFIIYLSLVIDLKDFGSFFEREMSAVLINTFTTEVIDFLIKNLTFGQSIPYQSLLRGLMKKKSFPEFLLLRVVQDLEFQGVIEVEINEFAQKSISLKDATPYANLILW
jgi:hypothetical protein